MQTKNEFHEYPNWHSLKFWIREKTCDHSNLLNVNAVIYSVDIKLNLKGFNFWVQSDSRRHLNFDRNSCSNGDKQLNFFIQIIMHSH